ncbi:hypothetical protein NHX12_032740 [Muraenolepis orangiensis]|uniref:Uncharacterized protein n=1 Tax=Muraenolepis orangiensis TaxID=630683 RepID=A0A9Q0D2Y8_9TELE|nr:hypothetical protein NHX12_032740 [Muraenolepis orangiensis]
MVTIPVVMVVPVAVVPALQGPVEVLPEEAGVPGGPGPAQVAAPPHQPPNAVVRGQLQLRQLLQEEEDQHVLLLVQQAVAGGGGGQRDASLGLLSAEATLRPRRLGAEATQV